MTGEEREGLPEGWTETTLGEVGSLRLGKMLDRTKNQGDFVSYLRNINVRWFAFDLTDLQELRISPQEREVLSVQNGDVFICEGGEPGRAAVWRGGSNALVYQKALHRFRPSPAVLPELVAYRLKHDAFTGQLAEAFTGTTIKHLPGEKLAAYSIPLPPLPEQRRIADKLDALLSRVDAGRERLERVPRLVKQFRQAVLSAAVSGELTREWRGGGEAEWKETTLGNALKVSSGKFLPAKAMAENGAVPVYGGNGVNGHHDQANVFTPTVVIGRVGFYCGSVHLTPGRAWVTDNALIVSFERNKFDTTFLFYALNATDLRENDSSSAQPVISGQKIYPLPFSIPPLPEQAEIVRRVEALFAIADRLEGRYQAALSSFERLTPALLARAFRGELVPQDPNDEPAAVLLERIRAQRAEGGRQKAGRRKPQAASGDGTEPKRRGKPPKAQADAETVAEPKRRGRPPGARADGTPIPTASSYEDAVRQLEARKQERAQGTRLVSLFEE